MAYSHQHNAEEIVVDDSIVLRSRSFDNEASVYALIDKNRAYLSKWVHWTAGYTPERLHQDIVETIEETAQGILCLFDIFYRDKYVGTVDAHDIVINQSAEVGYWLGEAFIGKGITTKAVQALIEYVHRTHQVGHFYLEIHQDNLASIRVGEKLGFMFDAIIIENGVPTGEARYVKDF